MNFKTKNNNIILMSIIVIKIIIYELMSDVDLICFKNRDARGHGTARNGLLLRVSSLRFTLSQHGSSGNGGSTTIRSNVQPRSTSTGEIEHRTTILLYFYHQKRRDEREKAKYTQYIIKNGKKVDFFFVALVEFVTFNILYGIMLLSLSHPSHRSTWPLYKRNLYTRK